MQKEYSALCDVSRLYTGDDLRGAAPRFATALFTLLYRAEFGSIENTLKPRPASPFELVFDQFL